jgi:hypothetical protein
MRVHSNQNNFSKPKTKVLSRTTALPPKTLLLAFKHALPVKKLFAALVGLALLILMGSWLLSLDIKRDSLSGQNGDALQNLNSAGTEAGNP